MITPENIQEIMDALATSLDIEFVRADQDDDRPEGEFFSYKITSIEPESDIAEIVTYKTVEVTEGESTEVEKTVTQDTDLPVSITLYGPSSDYHSLYAKARNARKYFQSDTGKEVCLAQGVFPRLRGPLQDRAAYLETGYESRWGFDVVFDGKEQETSIVGVLDITKTIAGMKEEA